MENTYYRHLNTCAYYLRLRKVIFLPVSLPEEIAGIERNPKAKPDNSQMPSCGCHIEDKAHSTKITVACVLEALSLELFLTRLLRQMIWKQDGIARRPTCKRSQVREYVEKSPLHILYGTCKKILCPLKPLHKPLEPKVIQESFISAASHRSDTDTICQSPKTQL